MCDQLLENLNQFLANLVIFHCKLQNYHWNIKGEDFFIVHEKLEEYYEEINDEIDEIGEHILILGGEPLGRMQDYLEKTKIVEAKNEKITSCNIYKNVKADFQLLYDNAKNIKKITKEESNDITVALMDEYLARYSKVLWMLKQQEEK